MNKSNKYIEYKTGEKIGVCFFVKNEGFELSGSQKVRIATFLCHCGKEFISRICNIKNGNTTSCGCIRKEMASKLNYKHGCGIKGKETAEFIAWQAMITRCENKNFDQYPDYGGRGIKICKKWRNSFISFLKDMGEKPTENHSLDRINNDKGYYKENCRWATEEEQVNNRRNSIIIEYKDKKQSLKKWSKELNIKYVTLHYRIKNMPIEKAFSRKVG